MRSLFPSTPQLQEEATAQQDISKAETESEEIPSVALNKPELTDHEKKGLLVQPIDHKMGESRNTPKTVVFCKGGNNF